MRVYRMGKKTVIIDHCIDCPRMKRCELWRDDYRVRVASGPVPVVCPLPMATGKQERMRE